MRFFLIDKITEFEAGKFAKAVKNVSLSEDFFDDHFPLHPLMPGVLLIEGMAQLSGFLLHYSLKKQLRDTQPDINRKAIMVTVSKAKFRELVKPGSQITYTSELLGLDVVSGRTQVKAEVDGKIVAEATLTFVMADNDNPVLEKTVKDIFSFWTAGTPPEALRY